MEASQAETKRKAITLSATGQPLAPADSVRYFRTFDCRETMKQLSADLRADILTPNLPNFKQEAFGHDVRCNTIINKTPLITERNLSQQATPCLWFQA
jgi:hypothetical protein